MDLTEIQSEDYESALMSANYTNEDLMAREEHHHYACDSEYRIFENLAYYKLIFEEA